MGLNNKLETAYMENVNTGVLNDLIGLFNGSIQELSHHFMQLETEEDLKEYRIFIGALGEYNLHTGNSLGCQEISYGSMLKGETANPRLDNLDFSQYLLSHSQTQGIAFHIDNEKVIFLESRALIRKLVNFEKGSNSVLRKEAKKVLQP